MTVTLAQQKVRRTFPSIPNDVRQWTSFLASLFFTREWTPVLSGVTTDPEGEVIYTVSAGVVVLRIPTITGTSDSTIATLTNLPDEIVTARDQICPARIWDNGVLSFGLARILAGTNFIELSTGADGGLFTASGKKGIEETTICYALD